MINWNSKLSWKHCGFQTWLVAEIVTSFFNQWYRLGLRQDFSRWCSRLTVISSKNGSTQSSYACTFSFALESDKTKFSIMCGQTFLAPFYVITRPLIYSRKPFFNEKKNTFWIHLHTKKYLLIRKYFTSAAEMRVRNLGERHAFECWHSRKEKHIPHVKKKKNGLHFI